MGNNATYDFDVANVINKDGLDTIFQIVALRYCVEQNKCLLVYKYMSEKSLQESFFEDGHLRWNWQTRFDNVIDVAEAFEFLHFNCDPLMIHGDIKSNNVMLDSDYRAKISDFELLRIKVKGEIGMNLFYEDLRSQELGKSHELSGTFGGTVDAHTPTIRIPMRSNNIEEIPWRVCVLWGPLFSKEDNNNCMQPKWQYDFYFNYGIDMMKENVLNEKSSVQVLRVLIRKTDTEMDVLGKEVVMFQSELVWYEYKEWHDICYNALRSKINSLDISINKLKIKDENGINVSLVVQTKPVEKLHEIVNALFKSYGHEENKQNEQYVDQFNGKSIVTMFNLETIYQEDQRKKSGRLLRIKMQSVIFHPRLRMQHVMLLIHSKC
ncbi:hypothetical protein V6N13_108382 [Hibiscus sabdariffa]